MANCRLTQIFARGARFTLGRDGPAVLRGCIAYRLQARERPVSDPVPHTRSTNGASAFISCYTEHILNFGLETRTGQAKEETVRSGKWMMSMTAQIRPYSATNLTLAPGRVLSERLAGSGPGHHVFECDYSGEGEVVSTASPNTTDFTVNKEE